MNSGRKNLLLFALLFVVSTIQTSAQLYINEICPANADNNYDEYYNFSGWVELYNAGKASVSLDGFHLSNSANEKTKWTIPTGTTIVSGGYVLIWCDGINKKLHANFSLDSDGEEVLLSTPGLAKVDYILYPKQYTNVSYGRTEDGAPTWAYSISPSPKGKNVSVNAISPLGVPLFSAEGGRYQSSKQISMSHSSIAVDIFYTIDGSEPTRTSARYSVPLTLSKTTVVKAKAFSKSNSFLPSQTAVNTYFINEHEFTLPVVSLSMKQTYLDDNTIGIYVSGTNGIVGNCQTSPRNWNQDWDRHADFEYFDKNGLKKISQTIDARISGACSRGMAQKSFAIKARDKYGKNTVDERIFKEKDIDEYGGFFLRNAGNDFNVASFRDAFMQKLAVSQMDIDYMAYQPATLYLNGQYWGIQNLREKIDGDYFESNYGIDKSDIDLLETNESAIEGTKDAYVQYKNTLQSLNPTDPATFKFIDDHIDVQEYINYLVSEIYYCNTDWPGNNQKFWRQRSVNGKFRWILWDTDFGFGLYSDKSYPTHATLDFATDATKTEWPNPAWSTLHIRLVLQNPIFRTKFIQTLNTAMLTTFKPERVSKFIAEFQNAIKAEMPFHKQRWGGTINDWNNQVQRLRDFAVSRNTFMQQHTATFFGLSEKVSLSVKTSPVNSGAYKLNGIVSNEPLVEGRYFKDLPFQIEALPHAGFVFKNWNITKLKSARPVTITIANAWKYFDQGVSPAIDWQSTSYDDASWSSGPAQLGYGEGDEKTAVSYGPDSNAKFITTYFRNKFSISALSDLQNIQASILFDDGVIVYLNGSEVYRSNMPAGAVNTNTLALQAIELENVFTTFIINKDLLVAGENTLAVEVHQNAAQSSDASFDFKMSSVVLGSQISSTVNLPNIADTAYTDVTLEAVFEPLTNPKQGIVINEFCAAKSNVTDDHNEKEDWIELHNTASQPVDVAGLYITDNLNFKTKYQIPEGGNATTIDAGKYLLLWADNQVSQGATHLNFKLSAEGEEIGLYQVLGYDTLKFDELSFETQREEASTARVPNAVGPFVLTAKITPAAENVLEVIMGMEENVLSVVVYPNPVDDRFFIRSEKTVNAVVIYDVWGRVKKQFFDVNTDQPIYIGDFTSGLYVVKILYEGKPVLIKIIKR